MFWKLKSRTFSLVRSSCLFIDDWYWTDYWCLFLSSSAASLSCSTVNTSWRETPPCPRRPPGSSSTAKSVTAARLQTPDQTPHPWQGGNQCCHVQQNWCCPAARVLLQSPPPEPSSRVHDLLLNPSSPETPLLRPSPLYQENALACLYFFAPLQRSFGWGNIWGRRALAVKWLNVCEGKQPMKK